MSVSLYRWTPDCDGQPCVGDCDKCGKEETEMQMDEYAKFSAEITK